MRKTEYLENSHVIKKQLDPPFHYPSLVSCSLFGQGKPEKPPRPEARSAEVPCSMYGQNKPRMSRPLGTSQHGQDIAHLSWPQTPRGPGYYLDERESGEQMEEKETNGVCSRKRGRTGDGRVVKTSWTWIAGNTALSHGGVLACPLAKDHFCVHGTTAVGVCYQQRSGGCSWLPPGIAQMMALPHCLSVLGELAQRSRG